MLFRSFNFLAKLPNVDTKVFGPVLIDSPYFLEDRPVAKNLPRMFGETEKQIKLQRCEADDPIANNDAMLSRVNAKVSYNQNTRCAESVGRVAPELNANSGTQLTQAERFGDVVISTSVEGFNLSVFAHAVREHNNGNLRDFSKLPAKFNTVHLRHGDISDNEIWLPFSSGDHALDSICRNMRQVTLGRERRSEHIGGLDLVVDDQDLWDAGTLAIMLTHGCTQSATRHSFGATQNRLLS